MPQLNRLTRLRQPWVLPAASSALQLQQLNNLETTAHAGIIGERSLATKATATSSSRSESWSVPASILAAGAALLGSALLTPGQASAKKELAILPGSKPSPAAAPAKPAGAAASEPAAAKGPAKDEKGRPIYTREEVAKHKTPKDRVWVTYKEGVYDITEVGARASLTASPSTRRTGAWTMGDCCGGGGLEEGLAQRGQCLSTRDGDWGGFVPHGCTGGDTLTRT